MKYLLFALCLLLAMTAHAQSATASPLTGPPKYCMLYTRGGSISSLSLYLDYGNNQRREMAVKDDALQALAVQVERFSSLPAALSYLDGAGWELVQVVTLPDEDVHHNLSAQMGYLLRRKP